MTTIKRGDFIIEDPDTISDTGDNKKGPQDKESSSSPTELDNPPGDVDAPELDPNSKSGDQYRRTVDKASPLSKKEYKSKSSIGKGGNKAKVASLWDNARRSALAASGSGGLSAKAKSLLVSITQNKPKVNWKKELKKFVDNAFDKWEHKIPNRRTLGRGEIIYGRKRTGAGTLKTLVLPVDTSGSISKKQIKVFFEEVWRLTTEYSIDKTIIIYCSDDIDAIDIVNKGKKPDLSKWASTGGNSKGFNPPFEWMEKNKINPSAVIYLTDSYASYPSVNQYGIKKYANKVFWFICQSGSNYDKPPFGRTIHIPMDQNGNFA